MLSCDKMGVEIRLRWGIWRSSGKTKLVSGGSIIICLTLLPNDMDGFDLELISLNTR